MGATMHRLTQQRHERTARPGTTTVTRIAMAVLATALVSADAGLLLAQGGRPISGRPVTGGLPGAGVPGGGGLTGARPSPGSTIGRPGPGTVMPGRPIGPRPPAGRPTTLSGRFGGSSFGGGSFGQPSLTPVPIGGLRTRPLTPVPPLQLRDGVYRNADPRYNDGRRYDGRDGDRRGYDGRGNDGRGNDGRGYDGRGHDGRGYDGRNDGRGYDGRGYDGRGYDGRRYQNRGGLSLGWIGAPYLGGLFLRNGIVVYAGSAYASTVVQSNMGVTVQDDADIAVEPALNPRVQPKTIMLTPVPDGDRVWYPTMDKPTWRVDSTLTPVQAWRDLIVRDAVCDREGNCREREQPMRAPWVATCRCYVLTDAVGRRWEIP